MAGKRHTLFSLKRREEALSDKALVERIQQGDQAAWAVFLERYTDLIYQKARVYSHSAQFASGAADWEDEAAELYLFMAGELQKSLAAFRGDCQPSSWVHAIINRRKAILKAYLRQKDPHRADVRVPRALENRLSAIEEQIFRHLVWGLEPEDIPLKLDASRAQCQSVEALVAESSPQVYERILENRRKRHPHLSLDYEHDDEDEASAGLQVADDRADPVQILETQALQGAVREGLDRAINRMSAVEIRVHILLYNHGASVEQVVALGAQDESLGLEQANANRVYYLKDRGLKIILEEIYKQLNILEEMPPGTKPQRRELFKYIEAFILEEGFPELRA